MSFVEALLARLPRALRRPVRRAALFPLDAFHAAARHPLTPPRGLQSVGAGDFEKVGRTFVRLFQDPGGLRPHDRVLDVGCGIGRMAVPLTELLEARGTGGTYDGFDVQRADVRWCRRAISGRYPRFRFTHVDVRSSEYNPRGAIAPTEFAFPYPDASFDFVFATSVFTHLLEPAAARYLREIARVLAPEGRFFSTFFCLDEESDAYVAEGRTSYRFDTPSGRALVNDPKMPEAAVGYRRADLFELAAAAGLRISSIERGGWAGGESASFQDVVVGERSA